MRIILFKLLGVLVLLASLLGGWVLMDYSSFTGEPMAVPPEGAVIVLEPGASASGLAERLERQGLIRSARYFRWMVRWSGAATRIQAGEYRVETGSSPRALMQQMIDGQVVQYSLTLLEGWSFRQVLAAVHGHPFIKPTLSGLDDASIMARLGHPEQHPEGRFFPDTYSFPRGITDESFLRRAYAAMEKRLAEEWLERAPGLPLQSPYEALILASVVEKETGLASERPAIAGVFMRRLRKGMRLQTDPTVIYGLGATFDGNLRRKDLERDNPYNTYRHRGLPPTPIAMPSGEAIHAALHPESGDTLYFVARGDGSHHFSATLEEHNAAVVKYQLKGRARPFSSSR